MKKILIILAVLFIANLGCKKIDEDNGGGLCACSPVAYPYMSLVVKNTSGDDLLNSTTANFFSKDQVQLFSKDINGVIKQINFAIRPPFSYGSQKFNFNQIFSEDIVVAAKTTNQTLYLKLGNAEPKELSLTVGNSKVEKLFIDKKEMPIDVALSAYNLIFYLNL